MNLQNEARLWILAILICFIITIAEVRAHQKQEVFYYKGKSYKVMRIHDISKISSSDILFEGREE